MAECKYQKMRSREEGLPLCTFKEGTVCLMVADEDLCPKNPDNILDTINLPKPEIKYSKKSRRQK